MDIVEIWAIYVACGIHFPLFVFEKSLSLILRVNSPQSDGSV